MSVTVPPAPPASPLDLDDLRLDARAAVAARVVPHLDEARRTGLFPRAVMADLAETGLVRRRWTGDRAEGARMGVVIAEELGRSGIGSLAGGVSLQIEAVLAFLDRFGTSDALAAWRERVLDGAALGCVAFSEPVASADLSHITCAATPEPGGWRVRGEKKFISLGATADFALVLCRSTASAGAPVHALMVALVPRDGIEVLEVFGDKVGSDAVDTTRLRIDAHVPDELVLCRPGHGLLGAMWGISHERLALAAATVGSCRFAVGLTTARLLRRRSGDRPLMHHAVLRSRLAELDGEVTVHHLAIAELARSFGRPNAELYRRVAAVKVGAARLGERVMSECLQLFGGCGYLESETPIGRLWRDIRLVRLAAGTDEIMWDLIGGGLVPDDDAYDALVRTDP